MKIPGFVTQFTQGLDVIAYNQGGKSVTDLNNFCNVRQKVKNALWNPINLIKFIFSPAYCAKRRVSIEDLDKKIAETTKKVNEAATVTMQAQLDQKGNIASAKVGVSDISDGSGYSMNFVIETIFKRSDDEQNSYYAGFAEKVDELLTEVCKQTDWKGGKIRNLSSYKQLVKDTNAMINQYKDPSEPDSELKIAAEESYHQLLSDLGIETDDRFEREKEACQCYFGIEL